MRTCIYSERMRYNWYGVWDEVSHADVTMELGGACEDVSVAVFWGGFGKQVLPTHPDTPDRTDKHKAHRHTNEQSTLTPQAHKRPTKNRNRDAPTHTPQPTPTGCTRRERSSKSCGVRTARKRKHTEAPVNPPTRTPHPRGAADRRQSTLRHTRDRQRRPQSEGAHRSSPMDTSTPPGERRRLQTLTEGEAHRSSP